jgi:phosphoribosylaminoimidazolecarboxamide formyltransferase / IMP cyclohydrolase
VNTPAVMPEGWPRTALLSLADKSGSVEFARALAARGTRLIASGGTARALSAAGLEVTAIEKWTGFDDLLGGRVKTLHPHVHAPILARRGVSADITALAERDLDPIDLVAVTLYPFEEKAAQLDESGAVEEIDIGGVALLRAAAKNFADVIVVHDTAQYDVVLAALEAGVTLNQRRSWAVTTFARVSRYDATIAADLARRGGETTPLGSDDVLPERVGIGLTRVRTLRYGENPHQQAALYARAGAEGGLHATREGKELSYNNLLDLEAAVRLVSRFERAACIIVKHNEPCGAAIGETPAEAYDAAFASDPLSAFGGIVAFNRPLDGGTAAALAKQFVECVAAPEVGEAARTALQSKKNLRVLELAGKDVAPPHGLGIRILGPWALIQRDAPGPVPEWRVVTRRAPGDLELAALRFAWWVAAAARSNAIAIASGEALIGLGSGQTSRVDAVDLALVKAKRAGHDVKGAVLASDGFFPFADNVEHAAQAGIAAVVQPGGSVRDPEVIEAADRFGIAMMFTDRRVFRH